MCRFLLAKSDEKIKPERLLTSFASMCEKSRTPDKDRQGDGWGIAYKYQISKSKKQKWILKKTAFPRFDLAFLIFLKKIRASDWAN